jgi:nucleoid-associated protein YgaU
VAEAPAEPEPAVAQAAVPVAEAPAEPAKSAEELEEERLWAETDAAWSAGDFQKVTESLDALKALQPEDAAAIDEKIAAAQFNQASAFEQAGDLERALYLFQEAQRRNPNLGEAGYAIERVQAALQPPAPPAEPEPVQEAAPPAEQSYTVADGDTLWAIAERHYGDGSQYTRIFEANRDQLDNPDVIQAGQVLRIPA